MHVRHETLGERIDSATRAIDFAHATLSSITCTADDDDDEAEAEAAITAAADAALDDVGFTVEMRGRAIRELSGGWRMRLLLATAVAQRPDVLLLDEPTNHLDVEAVQWLVSYLTHELVMATCLVVSHDAAFLDKICTDVIHFDACRLKYYKGNFSRFKEQANLQGEDEVRAVLQVRSGNSNEQREEGLVNLQ